MDTTLNRTAERVARLIEEAEVLDPLATAVARVLSPLRRLGALSELLGGAPLGHPAHPAAVLLPLGAWSSAALLDLVGGEASRDAAATRVGLGVLAATPAALTGAKDWLDTDGPARRVGLVHALTNSTALACFASSWWARRAGRHRRGVALGLAGCGVVTLSAWLGGHLTYARGVGVRAGAPGQGGAGPSTTV